MINLHAVQTWRLVSASILAVSLIPLASSQLQQQPEKAFVDKYCAGCHNEKSLAGGLGLSRFGGEDVAAHSEVWGEGGAAIAGAQHAAGGASSSR